MPNKINTAVMPGDNMAPETIEAAARNMSTVGTKISTQGGTVLTTWQKISASHDTPEEDTLFHAMNPVKTEAESFGTDVGTASTALTTFASEVRTIKAAVATIRADAATFLAGIENGVEKDSPQIKGETMKITVDWAEDQASVDANNALITRTNDQQEALWAAERKCANAIYDVIGHKHIEAASAANCQQGYGVDQIPDNADMPWGQSGTKKENCSETIVHAGANVVIGVGTGLAGLVGVKYNGTDLWANGDWSSFDISWANAGEAWKGLGMFAVGAVTFGPVGLALGTIPGPVGSFFRDSTFMVPAVVASLGSIDLYAQDPLYKWKENGLLAGSEAVFNIATLFVAPTKLGAAGKLGRAGEVAAKVTDPVYLAIQASRAFKLAGPTIESLARLEKAIDLDGLTKIDTPEIDIPSVRREDVSTDTPNVGNHDQSDSPNTGNHDRSDSPNDGTDAPPPREYSEPQANTTDPTPGEGRPGSDPADTPETAPGKDAVDDGSTNNPPAPAATQPELPKGIERQTWEPQAGSEPVSTANLQRVDATHPPVEFTTSNSNQLGKYGESLTKQALIQEGWDVIVSGRHIKMPGGTPGSYFVPDFIARDPLTGQVIAVEAKMGPGAHFTPGQLDGYDKLAQGQPLEARSAKMQEALDRYGITTVDAVQVFRWNTELVPDQALINAAGLAGKVKP